MSPDYHYSTAFGASIDIEIQAALRAGMPINRIATELGDRYMECLTAAIAKRQLQEEESCAA
jgi:hypothetical protein